MRTSSLGALALGFALVVIRVHIIGAKLLAANIIGKPFWVRFVRRAVATRPRCLDNDGIFGRNDDMYFNIPQLRRRRNNAFRCSRGLVRLRRR
jgi:hypothetical protein